MRTHLHFRLFKPTLQVAVALAVMAGAPRPAQAQLFSRPPAPVGDEGYGGGGADAAQQQVRIDRLENQVRSLNGQIEQLQFAQRRLEDLLKKFQQDVDFRFQDQAGSRGGGAGGASGAPPRQKRSELDGSVPGAGDVAVAGSGVGTGLGTAAAAVVADAPGGRRRGDAFDPARDPMAPGAPRALGQPGGGPIAGDYASAGRDPAAPLDLTGGATRNAGYAPPPPATSGHSTSGPSTSGPSTSGYEPPPAASSLGARPIGVVPPGARSQLEDPQAGIQANVIPAPIPANGARGGPAGGTVMAGLPPAGTKEEFDLALVSYNNGQFEVAEQGFRGFLTAHPRDKLVPDATFYLGEAYWKRGRAREAAEQYLKVSTDYAKSSRAPDSLLRLGLALEKLGAKEQACATWGEIGRKYPTASASVRTSAQRESKRLAC